MALLIDIVVPNARGVMSLFVFLFKAATLLVTDGTKAAARWRKEVAMRTVIAFGDSFMILMDSACKFSTCCSISAEEVQSR